MLKYRLECVDSQLYVLLEEVGKRRILYLDTLRSLAQGKDQEAVQFFAKLHLRANPGKSPDTLSFQKILLPPALSNQAIRWMAQTERLSFRQKNLKVVERKGRVHWIGTLHSEKSCTLQPFLESGGKEWPLEVVELLFPGSPSWVIVEGEWLEIASATSWKWMEYFQRTGTSVLEGAQKKNFLEEEPLILWNTRKEEQKLQVFPCLQLSDATGSFANLWMEYTPGYKIAFEDFAPQIHGVTRSKKEEAAWEKDLLEAGFQRKPMERSQYYCPGDKVFETLQFLLEVGWTCIDSRGRKILRQDPLALRLSEKGENLVIEGKIGFQGKEEKISTAMQKKGLFLELDATHVGLLDHAAFPRVEGEWEEDCLKIPKRRLGEVLHLLELKEVQWEESLRSAAKSLASGIGFEPLVLDQRFKGTLFPYQQQGVEWLSFLRKQGFGALLSDEMGLGKTVQVVAFFSQLRTNLPILIVVPASLLFQWRREIGRFWPDADVYVHSGPNRQKSGLEGVSIILTSYALLRIDFEFFSRFTFEVVCLDEAQAIKSYHSQIAEAAFQLKAHFKIAMTGTPVENRAEELWSQFRFLMPELFGSIGDFRRYPPETIRNRGKPFILRRKKSDVEIHLPEKVDCPLWLEMAEEQKQLYDQILATVRSGLKNAKQMEILEAILRLRQIACDPRLLDGSLKMGSKIEALLAAAEEQRAVGKKCLVFSQFAGFLRLIQRDLAAIGIEPLYLDGSTPAQEREILVRRFQEESQPHLFLLSLKAGGVGLNLTAAETVVLLDPWWNDAVERQAIDRAHRIGQKNTLCIYRYLTPGSIEEKMLKIKERKSQTAEQLLSGEEWSMDDLLELIDNI